MESKQAHLYRRELFDPNPSIEFDPLFAISIESIDWGYEEVDAHNRRAEQYWSEYWSTHSDVFHVHPAGVYHPRYAGPDKDDNVNRAKMGILTYTRKQKSKKLLQERWLQEEKLRKEEEQKEEEKANIEEQLRMEQGRNKEKTKRIDAIERDEDGNEIGDDVWPSPDEPFPYGGGGWQRTFNADGTIHHFSRDCPHCSGGSFNKCQYCGGTGGQIVGRGGRPISKREMDDYWNNC